MNYAKLFHEPQAWTLAGAEEITTYQKLFALLFVDVLPLM